MGRRKSYDEDALKEQFLRAIKIRLIVATAAVGGMVAGSYFMPGPVRTETGVSLKPDMR